MRPFKNAYYRTSRLYVHILLSVDGETTCNTRFPLLRFRSALHCGYSGITDIQDGLFFVLTRARTFRKARVRCAIANSKIFAKTFNIFIRGRYLYQ